MENSHKLIEQKEYLLKILDLHEFIKEDISYFQTDHIQVFNDKLQRINQELKSIHEQLDNFEGKFFAGI